MAQPDKEARALKLALILSVLCRGNYRQQNAVMKKKAREREQS